MIPEYKATLTYIDGSTYDVPSNGSTILTNEDIRSAPKQREEIRSAVIYDGVTELTAPFIYCTRLECVTIPESVTYISEHCFTNCTKLTDVTNNSSITSFRGFDSCENIVSVDIPQTVESVATLGLPGDYQTRIAEININDIESWCGVSMGSTSTYNIIPKRLFINGVPVRDLVIPATVTSLGDGNFQSCKTLETIRCLATTPPTLGEKVFDETNNCPIYVPVESYLLYKTAWSEYKDRIYPYSFVPPTPEPQASEYLTIEALESGSICINVSGTPVGKIYYSINGGVWTQRSTTCISVNAGDKVRFRSLRNSGTSTSDYITFTSSSCRHKAYGNPLSLYYFDNFADVFDLRDNYIFHNLFLHDEKLIDASGIYLPAIFMSLGCYSNMFSGCTALTSVPELPATELINSCYREMFYGCTSLTTVPSDLLPATTLASTCYYCMFQGCTSLTSVPELPATTMANACYESMFQGCTSLTSIPSDYLPATTLAEACYRGMFINCSGLTTIPSGLLSSTTLENYCYSSMFNGCRNITNVPSDLLPATTLTNGCYSGMFRDCSSLMAAPELPATTMAGGCYSYMFYRCTVLNYIKCLATGSFNINDTENWVNSVAASGTFIKAASASWSEGVSWIPSGWTVQNA